MTGAPWVVGNAVAATMLAVSVAVVARRVRRPGLVHAAWGAVMLRFVAVPVLEWPVLPAWTEPPACVPAEPAGLALPLPPPATEAAGMLPGALALVGLAGAAALLSLAAVRALRFARTLRDASPAPPTLQARADRVARELGLRRAPRVRVVSARIAPAVTAAPHSEIVLPAGLLDRLPPGQLDALLAHELAHVKRRDPWLRPLELLIVAMWWWHPVVWWARRNLRAAEERACDAMVVSRRPGRARDYADALVSAAAFLVPPRREVPVLATGFGVRQLKERLTMILDRSPERPLDRRVLLATGLALGLALLVLPTTGVPATTEAPPAMPAPPAPPRPGEPVVSPPLDAPLPPLPRLEDEWRALALQLESLEHRRAELLARAAELRGQTNDLELEMEVMARHAEAMARYRAAIEAERRVLRELAPQPIDPAPAPEADLGPRPAPEAGPAPLPAPDDEC